MAPADLSGRPTDAALRFRKARLQIFCAMGALAILVTSGAVWLGASLIRHDRAMWERGREVPAQVVRKYTTLHKGSPTWWVDYAYATPDGVRRSGSQKVGEEFSAGVHVGAALPVLYDSGEPRVSQIGRRKDLATPDASEADVVFAIGLILVPAWLVLPIMTWIYVLNARRVAYGSP